jgi:hypothetical protein
MLHSLRRGVWSGGAKAYVKSSGLDPQAQFGDFGADAEAFVADTDGDLVPYVGTDDEAAYMIIAYDVAGRRAKGYLRGRRTEAVGAELLNDPGYADAGEHVVIEELASQPAGSTFTAEVAGGVASFAASLADGGAVIISEEDVAARVALARFRMAATFAGDDIGRQFLFNKDTEDA